MSGMSTIIIIIQVLSALVIIGLVLLQQGKGADMGAAFGSGASGSLFGATGSSNFLSKSTAIAAAIFFAATLGLTVLSSHRPASEGGIMDKLPAASAKVAPAPAPAKPDRTASDVPVPTLGSGQSSPNTK